MKINRIIFVGLLMGLVSAITVINCDDKPTPPPEPEEHLFYIAPAIGNMVKVFSVEQAAMVDSFVIPNVNEESQYPMIIHVIGNDSLLAVTPVPTTYTYLVDLESKAVVDSFPGRNVTFDRHSRYYLRWNPETSLNEIRTYPGHVLVTVLPGSDGGFPAFCNQSESVSFISVELPDFNLGLYSFEADSVIRHIRYNHGAPFVVILSYPVSSFQKVFMGSADLAGGYYTAATDFASDTVRPLHYFDSEAGSIVVVSPDDKYLFLTDVVATPFGYVNSGYIYVYDVETEDSVAAIDYEGIDMASFMVISHDSRYLLATPYNIDAEFTGVCLIDAQEFSVIGVYECGFVPGYIAAKYCAKNGVVSP